MSVPLSPSSDSKSSGLSFVLKAGESPEQTRAFRAFADVMPQIIWISKADGFIDYFNRCALDYTGQTDAQARGSGWQNVLHPDDVARTQERWQQSVQTGEAYEIEYRLRRGSDGAFRWFLGRATALYDDRGAISRWFGTCVDIHDQKLAELSLQRAKEQSEQAGRAKDEFLAVLSHELRTPLSAILGWTQLLEMDALDPAETKEAVQTIKQQAKVQSQLIEDLLEVSRIINGKFHMRQQVVELWRVLGAAMDMATAIAAQNGVAMSHDAWDKTLLVRGDPQRLQQVAWNLLVNAVKFTPADGKIHVALTREAGEACISVRDSGQGIPVDQIEAIFERFKQLDPGETRAKGGLGLGLSIAKHIVQLHGGRITARSEGAGQGSSFTVTLPALSSAATPAQEPALVDLNPDDQTLAGICVLVVDDQDSARTVVASALRKFGATVAVATSAVEAFGLLQGRPFDLLVSDIDMPRANGIDLIQQVRGSTLPFNTVAAIALTAFASVDDQTRALAAGFNQHVPKPVEPLELIRRVLAAVRAQRGR